MFDHLICDCDGVLVDSEIIADRTLLRALSAAFPTVDFNSVAHLAFGQRTSTFLADLETRFGITIPAGFLAGVEREVDAELKRSLAPVAGVRDALEAVPLPAAVVSNSRLTRIAASLARVGLADIFGPRVFSAEQVARPKPHPDVYLHAARELGVAPERCLVIEDSVTGLAAARAAGMMTIAFVGASHVPQGYAQVLRNLGVTRIVEHMEQLPALIAAGLRGEFGQLQS
ncbi:HAD family hydrolase [Trinickia soli]|uniref:HAD family hydrolase n=1 Tax=Trinickia soli TaxID=380675 RepID=A0A2N7WB58_9BURK|nr:HAD family hydrolase [Trinickia soli]PMS26627.1 HAD family hydrolase [Trinickia soli]CAB3694343.1 6-phosphogluconate phosphatase [Trinickia soli]